MDEGLKSKLMWLFNIVVLLSLILVVLNSKEKPEDGYDFMKNCISFVDQDKCKYVNAQDSMCYNNCEFPQEMINIGPNDLPNYCKDQLKLKCKDYIKIERLISY